MELVIEEYTNIYRRVSVVTNRILIHFCEYCTKQPFYFSFYVVFIINNNKCLKFLFIFNSENYKNRSRKIIVDI